MPLLCKLKVQSQWSKGKSVTDPVLFAPSSSLYAASSELLETNILMLLCSQTSMNCANMVVSIFKQFLRSVLINKKILCSKLLSLKFPSLVKSSWQHIMPCYAGVLGKAECQNKNAWQANYPGPNVFLTFSIPRALQNVILNKNQNFTVTWLQPQMIL